jgi:hypothetical protein
VNVKTITPGSMAVLSGLFLPEHEISQFILATWLPVRRVTTGLIHMYGKIYLTLR